MHLLLIGGLAVAVYFLSKGSSDSNSGGNAPGSVNIPQPVAPVTTDQSCIGKTDAQGNWYGVDLSGNCTIGGLGGDSGDW